MLPQATQSECPGFVASRPVWKRGDALPDQPSNPLPQVQMAGGRPHHRFLLRVPQGPTTPHGPLPQTSGCFNGHVLIRPGISLDQMAQFPFFVLSCALRPCRYPTPPTVRFRLMVHPPAIGAFVYSVETRLFRDIPLTVSERGHFEAAVFSLCCGLHAG